MYRLFEAKKRFGLTILGLMVTLNHIHGWIEETLGIDRHVRDSEWTWSVAVGSKEFIEMRKDRILFDPWTCF
jgi:hypothetical protein